MMDELINQLLIQVDLSDKYRPNVRKQKRIEVVKETLHKAFMMGVDEGMKRAWLSENDKKVSTAVPRPSHAKAINCNAN